MFVVHVIDPVLEAEVTGAAVFCGIATVANVDVQPAEVTAKLYVPAVLTDGVAVLEPEIIPGPVHAYVPPPEPDKVTVGFAHVNVFEEPAFAVGSEFTVTVANPEAGLVQPPLV